MKILLRLGISNNGAEACKKAINYINWLNGYLTIGRTTEANFDTGTSFHRAGPNLKKTIIVDFHIRFFIVETTRWIFIRG